MLLLISVLLQQEVHVCSCHKVLLRHSQFLQQICCYLLPLRDLLAVPHHHLHTDVQVILSTMHQSCVAAHPVATQDSTSTSHPFQSPGQSLTCESGLNMRLNMRLSSVSPQAPENLLDSGHCQCVFWSGPQETAASSSSQSLQKQNCRIAFVQPRPQLQLGSAPPKS